MPAGDRVLAGRYRLRHLLGAGGMGRVWLATDEVLHRDVAVKEIVLPDGLSAAEREQLRQRTLREARAAARLNHPNVVRVYDVLAVEDRPWIVMEYVRSRSLLQVVRTDGPLSPVRAATVGLALLAALRAAHAAGVLHRDVKPGNVLLAEDGRVVLTDFGLAVFDTGEGAVTRPGLVLGSPQYIAPERARDGVSSTQADLWSLGATLYAAVEGRPPYARDGAMATLTALATQAPRPPVRAGPLKPVLDGLLRRNPRARLPPAQVEPMLRRVAAGRSAGRRRPRLWAVAALASAALLVPAVLALRPPHGGPGPSTVDSPTGTAVGVPACGPAVSAPPQTSPRSHRYAPLPGWHWHDDPGGFSIVVPDGWSYSRSGSVVCFRSPAGERVLAVDALGPADLGGYWQAREAQLTDSGRLPGFTRLRVGTRDFWRACTTWEFSYRGADGRRVHQTAWAFQTAPGRSYAIYWSTPEPDWSANLANFALVTVSFTP